MKNAGSKKVTVVAQSSLRSKMICWYWEHWLQRTTKNLPEDMPWGWLHGNTTQQSNNTLEVGERWSWQQTPQRHGCSLASVIAAAGAAADNGGLEGDGVELLI